MDKLKSLKIVISVFAVLICGVIYVCGSHFSKSEPIVTESFQSETDEENEPTAEREEKVYIHICGAVKKPGVYAFLGEPRVVEVVKKAGGFTKKADKDSVNQAQIVTDGTQLVISKKKKQSKNTTWQGDEPEQSDKVNLNTASRDELMTLSGVGESKADAILSYRESNGAFKKIEDIMNIPGIKDGVFNKIKESITV